MKLDINRATVYKTVKDCFADLYHDFDNGVMGNKYRIEVPVIKQDQEKMRFGEYKQPIRQPEIVYNMILDHGLEATVESFTDDLLKKIFGKI